MGWTWEYFKEEDGCSPVQDLLRSLQPKEQVRARLETLIRMELLCRDGCLKERKNVFKPINGLWQFRAFDCRILGKVHPNKRCHFVLLHAFVKKSDKTPPGELIAAEKNWEKFLKLEQKKQQKKL